MLCREFKESVEKSYFCYSKLDIPSGFNLGRCPDFRRREVSIISSLPGQGKTAFIISVLNNLITGGKFNAAVFLPDMPTAEFFSRLTASRAGVAYSKVAKGQAAKADWALFTKTLPELSKAGLWISAFRRFSSSSVYAQALELARELKSQKKKLDIIFIDSINCLTNFSGRRSDKTEILRALSRLAEDTDTAVVCTYSPENPRLEKTAACARLQLRDFRACGINEDSVSLILNIAGPEESDADTISKSEAELNIVWRNMGTYGYSLPIKFDRDTLKFYSETLPPK